MMPLYHEILKNTGVFSSGKKKCLFGNPPGFSLFRPTPQAANASHSWPILAPGSAQDRPFSTFALLSERRLVFSTGAWMHPRTIRLSPLVSGLLRAWVEK